MEQRHRSEFRNILGDSVPFKGLDPIVLDHILDVGLLLEAKKGDTVFFAQLRGPGLYVVLKGAVEVFRPSTKGKPKTLNTLRVSDCFGEYSLLDGKTTSASLRAASTTHLYFLPRGEFERLTHTNAATGRTIYHNLLLYLIERLRQKDQAPPQRSAAKKRSTRA